MRNNKFLLVYTIQFGVICRYVPINDRYGEKKLKEAEQKDLLKDLMSWAPCILQGSYFLIPRAFMRDSLVSSAATLGKREAGNRDIAEGVGPGSCSRQATAGGWRIWQEGTGRH